MNSAQIWVVILLSFVLLMGLIGRVRASNSRRVMRADTAKLADDLQQVLEISGAIRSELAEIRTRLESIRA